MIELTGKYNNDCKIFIDEVEESALSTIQSILDDEVSKDVPVRIMPDTHDGKDIVIGFTMPLTDRVNPNHIGVDIGCGVLCAPIEKPDLSLEEIDKMIRDVIPLGFNKHQEPQYYSCDKTDALALKIGENPDDIRKQIGTLGGGNHFIEIGSDQSGQWYLFIHSGSRNFGLKVCNYHVKKAKLKGDKYLFDDDLNEYIQDMATAQMFARVNRLYILLSIIDELDINAQPTVFDTVHNYIGEDGIIRKGAVSARKGEMMAIPFNMRDGVIIAKGKGNADWNYSAPHGAGRVLSRTKAKQSLSIDDFKQTMDGIYSTSINENTLDESPMAYKDADLIRKAVEPTAQILFTVKPILNIKADK